MWKEKITKLCEKFDGVASVAICGLESGEELILRPDFVMPSASTIKLPILLCLYDSIAQGILSAADTVELTGEDLTGVSGILSMLQPGREYTLYEYALLMIVLSDNTAANVLIKELGTDAINRYIRTLGLTDTVLARKMMDFEARKRGVDNFTSVRDMKKLLEYIYRNEDTMTEVLDILKRQMCRDLVPHLMPEGTVLAHKTGGLPDVMHDAGILYGKEPVLFCVFLKGYRDPAEAKRLHNTIGELIYQEFGRASR